jgi:pimeloyl-ACP methyl ester carboxylesterase
MRVLFVHGMGRTPLSGWPLLHRLRQAGLRTTTFGYSTFFENFNSIKLRLISKVSEVAGAESYILVGHSLGGVLIRAALNALPEHVERPRHVFLLGSPIQPSSLAIRLKNNLVYRAFTGDCGQLLASQARMNQVGSLSETTTSIAGVSGFVNRLGLFGSEPNDGIVSVIEVSAPWLSNQQQVPVVHTLLPASARVAEIILRELRLASRRNRKQELPSPEVTNLEVGNQNPRRSD